MATTNQIVYENVNLIRAPQPSTYQRSGAVISVGGTTLTTNSYQYISQNTDLTNILSATGNFTELTNFATTFFAQGTSVGFYVLELGVEATSGDDIPLLQTWIDSNPGKFGAYSAPGVWDGIGGVSYVTITNGGSGYTTSTVTATFSAPAAGTTATGYGVVSNGSIVSFVITNPGTYASSDTITVTFPAPTSGITATATATFGSAFSGVASNYSAPDAKTYFWIETTSTNLALYAAVKSIECFVPSPTATSTELGNAAIFYQWVLNNPGAANKLAPMGNRYVYGVTPWPSSGYTSEINTILSAYGNIITTGAEGGISNAIIRKGTFMSGDQMSWWYGVDWFQINAHQAIAAEVINGSNQQPPLLYDQPGINTLEGVAQQKEDSAVQFGCVQSATVSATSFYDYTQANPSAYAAGDYEGFTATIVGQNGFLTITVTLDVLTFA